VQLIFLRCLWFNGAALISKFNFELIEGSAEKKRKSDEKV
jgi:hypothetical protein